MAMSMPGASTIYTDHDTVLAVQTALKAKSFDPGPLDGVMGPKTAAAITAYWATKGVSRAPVVDAALLHALNVPVSSGGRVPSMWATW